MQLSSQDYMSASEPLQLVVAHRSYDLSICYDKFYRVPRVYLSGYDEHRQPLTPEQICEDLSTDHAYKTVTFESHPFLATHNRQASIHPCKHAATMKRLCDMMAERNQTGKEAKATANATATADSSKAAPPASASLSASVSSATPDSPIGLTPRDYLFIFLKFISSVVPTIEYDYTMR